MCSVAWHLHGGKRMVESTSGSRLRAPNKRASTLAARDMSDQTLSINNLLKRRERFAGIVGNGRTCALIDARGRIGWLCLPTFVQFPVFARLLDPVQGGCLELGILADDEILWFGQYGDCDQRYLPRTNVLETNCTIADGRVIVHDAMPWGQDCLIRDIRFDRINSSTHLAVKIRPTFAVPPHARFSVTPVGITIEETRCAAQGRLVCDSASSARTVLDSNENQIVYEFTPRDNRVTLTLRYENHLEPQSACQNSIQACAELDTQWLNRAIRLALPDQALGDAFERSLLALRLLTYEPTGAILAAATASFPSEPGGQRNWDYRYCWVRDGCYTARAFDLAGCHQEAERLYRFMLERETNGQWRSPLWSIEPKYPTAEEEIAELQGPAGEKPIRIGNGAALQEQHDSPGNVIVGVYEHCALTGSVDLGECYWESIARVADWCGEHWAEVEAGIWEKRDRNRAWVHGRAMCWAALRDAIRLARMLGKPAPSRWESAKAEIAHTLPEAAWSEERGAFLRVCGEPSVYDSSVLSLLLEDLIRPDDQRMRRTVDKLEKNLAYHFGFRRDESVRSPFYLSTLWMIRALQRIGEYDGAYAYLRSVIAGATNLDLMAEYFDPLTSRQYGNFPQAFSHAELVRAVMEMLWRLDDQRLILFPAIPSEWLTPGSTLIVSDIPLGTPRGRIVLNVTAGSLDFTTTATGRRQLIVPPRYLQMDRRVRLNGTWQN